MSSRAWVIGRGGLLGSAIERALAETTEVFVPEDFDWENPAKLAVQMNEAVAAFAAPAPEHAVVYWAAGKGTMSSTQEELEKETATLKHFLNALEGQKMQRLTFVFASSAGAVYAGCMDDVITEHSEPSPTSAYGREKLRQENMLRELAQSRPGTSVLIARLSNLFGPGQAHGKKQGLLTHIARCLIQKSPIHIYVPLDTTRDYIHVQDAAQDIIAAAKRTEGIVTKIIASETPATIASIIGAFRRISRGFPRLVTSVSELQRHYPHRMRFRSVVLPEARTAKRTNLQIGIADVLRCERLRYAAAARNS